jgi:hypothetical protein
MLFLAGTQWVEMRSLQTRGVVTSAEITDVSSGRQPVISVAFTTVAGRDVEGQTHNYKGDPELGDIIRVIYDPKHPSHFQDERWGYPYWLPAIPAAGGAFFAAMTLYIAVAGVPAWFTRNRRPRAR